MTGAIVVGVDGSASALAAARTAARLAQQLNAELHVVTAYGEFESETFTSGAETFMISTEAVGERIASGVLDDLRADYPDVAFSLAAAKGKPAVALVSVADQVGAEMIVVGNKRVQGITRVLGSVAKDVASRANCDVYVANTHPR